MSVQAITWAIQTTIRTALPHCPSHILIILANYANQDGYSWPSQAHIAESCGMSKRQVIRGLQALEVAGHITRHRRYSPETGYQVASMYHLELGLSDIVSPSEAGRLSDKYARLSDKSVGPKCQGVTPLDTKGDTKEDTKEKTRVRACAADAAFAVGVDDETQTTKKRARRTKQVDRQTVLPAWLPKEVWQEWIKHRKQLKAPMTDRAQTLLINKLEKMRPEYNVVELLETAIINGWKSVYLPRGNGNGKSKLSQFEKRENENDQWLKERTGKTEYEWQLYDAEQERDAITIDGIRIQ